MTNMETDVHQRVQQRTKSMAQGDIQVSHQEGENTGALIKGIIFSQLRTLRLEWMRFKLSLIFFCEWEMVAIKLVQYKVLNYPLHIFKGPCSGFPTFSIFNIAVFFAV